jgi:hypothetical protein
MESSPKSNQRPPVHKNTLQPQARSNCPTPPRRSSFLFLASPVQSHNQSFKLPKTDLKIPGFFPDTSPAGPISAEALEIIHSKLSALRSKTPKPKATGIYTDEKKSNNNSPVVLEEKSEKATTGGLKSGEGVRSEAVSGRESLNLASAKGEFSSANISNDDFACSPILRGPSGENSAQPFFFDTAEEAGDDPSESLPGTALQTMPTIRRTLYTSLKSHSECKIIDFGQALQQYNTLEISAAKHKKLWKKSLLQKFCSCFAMEVEIEDNHREASERYVNFAYSQFTLSNPFHKNLLISVYTKVYKVKRIPDNPEDLLLDVLKASQASLYINNRVLLVGLMNVLFLDAFFQDLIEKMLEKMNGSGGKMMEMMLRLTKLNLEFLRQQRLNELINKSLELFFFLFAGLCLYSLNFEIDEANVKRVVNAVAKEAKPQLEIILLIAKHDYINQNTEA